MYKVKAQSPITKAVPTAVSASKRGIRSPLPCIHKENLLLDTNSLLRDSRVGAKQGAKLSPLTARQLEMPELIELKLTQPLPPPTHSRRKLARPWAARHIDLNQETIRPGTLRASLLKTREPIEERRGSQWGQSRELEGCRSELRGDEWGQTVRLVKAVSTRERSETSRDKTGCCKIALKKSVFPLRRTCEQRRIFGGEEEELLSTI
jgi:hypothetical protein